MIHVPYKGGGAVLADVVAGHIQSTMTTPPAALPLVKSGRLRILAAASAKRSPLLPDVPTFAESGSVTDVSSATGTAFSVWAAHPSRSSSGCMRSSRAR